MAIFSNRCEQSAPINVRFFPRIADSHQACFYAVLFFWLAVFPVRAARPSRPTALMRATWLTGTVPTALILVATPCGMCRQSVCEQRQPKKLPMFGKFYCHDIVTQELLRYTFRDVISSRFKTKHPHTADAALVASVLYIN